MFNLESSPGRRIFQPSGKALKVGWATEPLCERSFGSIALRWKIWLLQSWEKLHPEISWNQSPRKGMFSLSLSLNLVNSPTHSVGQSPKWLQMMMIYPYVELKFYVCCESVNVADQLRIVNENFFSCVLYGSTLWLKPITLLLAVKSCLQGS